MTDNEIIKALECCLGENAMCELCPYDKHPYRSCMDNLLGDVLDLINRQKAEIERLKDFCDIYSNEGERAIKEFAERLKSEFEPETNYGVVANFTIKLFRNTIDNLVKEMAGDDE